MVNKVDRPGHLPFISRSFSPSFCGFFRRPLCRFTLVYEEHFVLCHKEKTRALRSCSGSRKMAYTTRNTFNRLARKELINFKSRGIRTIKGERNLYIELQKHKLDQIAAKNIKISRISLDKRIAFLK